MKIEIYKIKTDSDLVSVKELFKEYVAFLGINLDFQDFDKELATLPNKYAEPAGAILLAKVDEKMAGCVAMWKLEEGVCEMKRLFIRPDFRGHGLGKKMALAIMDEARQKGYKTMKLDTLRRLESAYQMYRNLGFRETKPYNFNPEDDVAYFEIEL